MSTFSYVTSQPLDFADPDGLRPCRSGTYKHDVWGCMPNPPPPCGNLECSCYARCVDQTTILGGGNTLFREGVATASLASTGTGAAAGAVAIGGAVTAGVACAVVVFVGVPAFDLTRRVSCVIECYALDRSY